RLSRRAIMLIWRTAVLHCNKLAELLFDLLRCTHGKDDLVPPQHIQLRARLAVDEVGVEALGAQERHPLFPSLAFALESGKLAFQPGSLGPHAVERPFPVGAVEGVEAEIAEKSHRQKWHPEPPERRLPSLSRDHLRAALPAKSMPRTGLTICCDARVSAWRGEIDCMQVKRPQSASGLDRRGMVLRRAKP